MNVTSNSIYSTFSTTLFAMLFWANAVIGQNCPNNLLTNPGFEDGLNSWTVGSEASLAQDPHTGAYSCHIGGASYSSIGQVLPTTPGKSYTLRVWAKYTGISYKAIQLRFLNTSWATLPGTEYAEVNTSVYTEYTLTGTAPIGAAYVYAFALKDGNGSIEVDDFCLALEGSGGGGPADCTQTLGLGDLLCTQKNSNNLEVFLENNGLITEYILNAQGAVISTQNAGPLVMDSMLVQGNQVVKKLADGTIVYTKTIPQSVLDNIPVVQAAAELTDGTIVLAGYQQEPITNPPTSPARNALVMAKTDANLNPMQFKTKFVSQEFNPYYTFSDFVLGIYTAPNAAFDIFYSATSYSLITYKNLILNRFSFNDPQSFDNLGQQVGSQVGSSTVNVTKTPCNSYRYIGPVGSIGQKGYFFGEVLSYYDATDLSFISAQTDGSGSLDYYGSYESWSFHSEAPDILNGSFQFRPTYDPIPPINLVMVNSAPPQFGLEVPYSNYIHAIRMGSSGIFLFGKNSSGEVYVEVPTDCNPITELFPDITGTGTGPYNIIDYQPGDEFPFYYNVSNTGDGITTSEIGIKPYFSTDAVLDASDFGFPLFYVNGLPAGQSIGDADTLTLPANLPGGNYYLILKLDADGANAETNENNNVLVSTSVITVLGGSNTGQIDLSLALQQLTANPAQWSSYPVKLTVNNGGPQPATAVKVKFAKPAGVVYVGANPFTASQGSFNPNGDEVWTVGSIPANGSATLTVNYFLLNATAPVAYAQVTAANETDVDSTPGNGTPPLVNEDDEASTDEGTNNIFDLSVSNVLPITGTVMPGDNLTGEFSLYYAGTFGTVNFKYATYLSVDPVLSADDYFINNQLYQVTSFPSGVATPFQVNFTMPSGLPAGQIYFIAVADPNDEIVEIDEGNNIGFNSFLLDNGTGNQPDLTLADLQIPTASVAAGAILSYNFDASNAGTAAVSGNFTIKSYISTDNVLSANDIQDGTIPTGNYGVGFSVQNVAGASTIPANLAAGSYFLIVKIDADNAIAEGNENNNLVVKPFTVTGGGGNLPDLTVLNFTTTLSSGQAGFGFGVEYTVQNIGTGNAGAFETTYIISSDNVPSADDYFIGGTGFGNGLAAGSSESRISNLAVPATIQPGSYFLIVAVNIQNQIPESSFGNNQQSLPITIVPTGGGDPCDAITITPAPGQITIAGANAPHVLIKVFKPNWQLAFECLDNCGDPVVVDGLANGNHYVQVKLIDAGWGEICYLEQTVNVSNFGGGGGNNLVFKNSRQRMAFDKIYPNPAQHFVTLEVYSKDEQPAIFDFYNAQGQAIHRVEMDLAAGRNDINLNVIDWKSGAYNIIGRGNGTPAYGRFLKVWE